MTCDELELLLPEVDAAAQEHLAGCAHCRDTAALLSAAALPVPGAAEKALLAGLPTAVQTQWVAQQRRRSSWQTAVGLAVAASVGAVVASALMWRVVGAQPPPAPLRADPEVWVLMEDSAPPSDEELNFEVSWPSLNEEGDVL